MTTAEAAPGRRSTGAPLLRTTLIIVALALATFLVGAPLLRLQWMNGHDSLAYIPRHVEFYEGLRAGAWFPRWAPDLGAGYGEPTFNFNPPVIYYVTALFHFVGFGFVASENLAIFALLALCAPGMYLLASEFFGWRGGVVSGIAYLVAPYLLSRRYVSHALADYAAFPFLPFAMWGLWRFCLGGQSRALLVGAGGAALVILSSLSVALLAIPALALLVGCLWLSERRSAILTASACGAFGGAPAADGDAAALLDTALQAHQAGKIDEATAAYKQVVAKDPKNKFALYNLGLIEQTAGRAQPAEQNYRAALAVDGSYGPALFNLAILRSAANSTAEAIDLYKKVIALEPQNAGALLNLGFELQKSGQAAAADTAFKQAVAIDPKLAPRLPAPASSTATATATPAR